MVCQLTPAAGLGQHCGVFLLLFTALLGHTRDVTVQKIETIIKEQFAVEMKSKEHEIEVIDQRLIEARRMMDKLRACIVANYYASAGLLKAGEGTRSCDATILNHPSIKKFLESPSRSSSPAHQGSDTPSANHSESDSLSQHNDFLLDKDSGSLDADERLPNSLEQRQSRNAGRDSSGVSSSQKPGQRNAGLSNDETSRLYVKKTIVVGNVSKYIPPDKREENDQSTHKWMVYVRGSRREPSINHFVKKVWFFLHPSYKPNDLVEVREPPFHLTRRGWGEFPVRVQIHFKDSQNKRIDIIHNLKLDRTYTGLQTLGAETVVDVELHRHSLGEEYLFSQSSESDLSDVPTSLSLPLSIPAPVKASSPIKQLRDSSPDASVDKGFSGSAETERHAAFYSLPSAIERTPTKLATQKVAFGSHGNSAFQPIAASCKIVPQGSPISTPSPSPLPRTPTSTPVHMKQGSASSVLNNPYLIVDKPGQVGAAATSTGSPTSKLSSVCQASHGTASPVAKTHGSSFGTSAVKQEDSLFATMPPLCPIGSHSKVQSPKSVTGGLGAFTKSSSSVAKAVGSKQVVTQGVAKAIVSGGGGTIVAQPVQTITKAQVSSTGTLKSTSQGSVMATLQLPATNLANLANLPPGTKLYLTTNSKNPSGKGKLLLIPQGAILRATNNANLQSGSSANSGGGGGGGGGSQSTSSNLSQHLTYTSYILKQTPQATSTGQTSLVKISDGSIKSVPASSQLSKPGTTVLRVSGGVITTAAAPAVALPSNGVAQQTDNAASSSSSAGAPAAKAPGQQHQICVSQSQPTSSAVNKSVSSSVERDVDERELEPLKSKFIKYSERGWIRNIRVNKNELFVCRLARQFSLDQAVICKRAAINYAGFLTRVRCEHVEILGGNMFCIEYLENVQQLLTAIVKKVPLIAEKSEDVSSFCASSVEQYYSWNIGKRRAAEWQRAMTVRKILQEIVEKHPRFHSISPLKTKHVVQWCRCHGYTPPDPEALRSDEDSIEDKHDNAHHSVKDDLALHGAYISGEELCRKLEELQQFLKQEPEHEEEVDILNFSEPLKINIKKEQEEKQEEMKFYMASLPASEFVRDTAEKIGISFQPAEVQKNVYASVIEDMILKATEQLMSDILRQALAVAYQTAPHNRTPREITVMNIHKAICNIPFLDFLTNKHMKILNEEQ
ncbi:hypothetical protein EK904_000463 [Melospiza melodia maxima]|nr:hypothetical protein EK904_000463 [Melospiza melodia maxima]